MNLCCIKVQAMTKLGLHSASVCWDLMCIIYTANGHLLNYKRYKKRNLLGQNFKAPGNDQCMFC